MKSILHKANTRGQADLGWLNSHHTFSFAAYHNPERMNFGVLRVLNDDVVSEGRGFGTHPHSNMEIISIPLKGNLKHMDSMDNVAVIKEGDVQVMSAGTGVSHSEYNENKDEPVEFLQIWIIPNKQNVTPKYDQISLKEIQTKNKLYQILSPNKDDQGVWIHQNAWFHLGDFENTIKGNYTLNDASSNGVYIFVLEGRIKINTEILDRRDGYGIWATNEFDFETLHNNTRILVMEVPMHIDY
ncbi:pirin family protein [Aquimarina agarivorans]|uniref:pirin family protein n=1 Tax=Aquimarina agarivorans TaxID=980584 RepID=UPI000248F297|nr:pirin family protein [Aquimarina agarivorans]